MPEGQAFGFTRPLVTANVGVRVDMGIDSPLPSRASQVDIEENIEDSISGRTEIIEDVGVKFDNDVSPVFSKDVRWVLSVVALTDEPELMVDNLQPSRADIGRIENIVKEGVTVANFNIVEQQSRVSVLAR